MSLYGEWFMVKTTILLRDDLYETIVKRFGRRNISKAINENLEKALMKPKKSMFGVDPWLNTKKLRDEEEHAGL